MAEPFPPRALEPAASAELEAPAPVAVVYLEPDDEIPVVARRIREESAERVVLVAPPRSKATSGAVALRLLARLADQSGRRLILVGDAATRARAVDAEIESHPSLASVPGLSAGVPGPVTDETAPLRTRIRVVRGVASSDAPTAPVAIAPFRDAASDTSARHAVPRPSSPRPAATSRGVRPAARRFRPRPAFLVPGAVVMGLLLTGAAAAFVLPSAEITITPQARPVGPISYRLIVPATEQVTSGTRSASGVPSGERIELGTATGAATFSNWNTVAVRVPAGTPVAAGETVFETLETVDVPAGQLGFDLRVVPGSAVAPVRAVTPGLAGNVAADEIDTIQDQRLRTLLRGFFNNQGRLVANAEPTAGGSETPIPVITAEDVAALEADLRGAIAEQVGSELGAHPDRLYVALAEEDLTVQIAGADELVGAEGLERFELSASYEVTYRYVSREVVEREARERFAADPEALPDGYALIEETLSIRLGERRPEDGAVLADVTVSAQAAPEIDTQALPARLAGKTPRQAQALLAPYGDASVRLWPEWAETIPRLEWRVSISLAPVRTLDR